MNTTKDCMTNTKLLEMGTQKNSSAMIWPNKVVALSSKLYLSCRYAKQKT